MRAKQKQSVRAEQRFVSQALTFQLAQFANQTVSENRRDGF